MMESSNTDYVELCALCSAKLRALVNHPRRAECMVEGIVFIPCVHNSAHAAWIDGCTSVQHCASEEHYKQICAGYVASKRQVNAMTQELIARTLAAAGRPTADKPS
jgi:hypothetical protein